MIKNFKISYTLAILCIVIWLFLFFGLIYVANRSPIGAPITRTMVNFLQIFSLPTIFSGVWLAWRWCVYSAEKMTDLQKQAYLDKKKDDDRVLGIVGCVILFAYTVYKIFGALHGHMGR